MKFTFKYDEDLDNEDIIITHNSSSKVVEALNQFLINQQKSYTSLSLYTKDTQLFVKPNSILFFETSDGIVYAHTSSEAYETNYKLYELEEKLPDTFLRISKSTICNLEHVYSISRKLTSVGSVKFINSLKEVYVSRNYYNDLKISLEKRIILWDEIQKRNLFSDYHSLQSQS